MGYPLNQVAGRPEALQISDGPSVFRVQVGLKLYSSGKGIRVPATVCEPVDLGRLHYVAYSNP
jgi:hypothetical protein